MVVITNGPVYMCDRGVYKRDSERERIGVRIGVRNLTRFTHFLLL